MPTLSDPRDLQRLEARLGLLRRDTPGRWGSLSPGEMLCHLADSNEMVLARPGNRTGPNRPIYKWLVLRSPIPWPRGVKTLPAVDPRQDGSRPGEFEADRDRLLRSLRRLAEATAPALPDWHPVLKSAMSPEDWKTWAWRHADHHLRQFGL
ncbi:MAG: DinB family protein [Acidobacteria bacterium]|nr:DinB family protein [Acidobacteriota bacterium]